MAQPRGTRRRQQAAETRRTILAAARHLFGMHGYSATTISSIAADAGVAIQTIYDSVGPKRAILLALLDVMDEEAGVQNARRELDQHSDPAAQIAIGVKVARQFPERFGDLLQTLFAAAPLEPDVAAALDEGMRRHRAGADLMIRLLSENQALRPELTVDRASDIFGLLTSILVFRQLTENYGWTFDECQEWMTETLIRLLLPGGA
jgi:AcrR family transcriptional regulator